MNTPVKKRPTNTAPIDIQRKLESPSEDLFKTMIKDPSANVTHTNIINIKKQAQNAAFPSFITPKKFMSLWLFTYDITAWV